MSGVLELLQSGEPGEFESGLALDIVFCSPVAEYHGRDDVAHVLGLVSRVLSGVRPCRSWAGDGETVHAFTACVGARALEGMVRERRASSGELSRVTLFLRPYRTLGVAITQMQRLLAETPLPSRSG
jgi:hypothetical protein